MVVVVYLVLKRDRILNMIETNKIYKLEEFNMMIQLKDNFIQLISFTYIQYMIYRVEICKLRKRWRRLARKRGIL